MAKNMDKELEAHLAAMPKDLQERLAEKIAASRQEAPKLNQEKIAQDLQAVTTEDLQLDGERVEKLAAHYQAAGWSDDQIKAHVYMLKQAHEQRIQNMYTMAQGHHFGLGHSMALAPLVEAMNNFSKVAVALIQHQRAAFPEKTAHLQVPEIKQATEALDQVVADLFGIQDTLQ